MNKLDLAKTTTNPKILDELSKDEDWGVRWGVAVNSNTSPETLDYLSRDEDYNVRYRVARNLNTTSEILDYLSKDKYSSVRWGVADNSNTSPETLKQMSIAEDSYYVKYSIKNNPNCLLETWKYLSALEIIKTLSKVST